MSGGREQEFPGEKRILIDSPKVATYDLKPEMSAYEVTDALLKELKQRITMQLSLTLRIRIWLDILECLEPTIKAIEAVDECLGKVVDKILELGGTCDYYSRPRELR